MSILITDIDIEIPTEDFENVNENDLLNLVMKEVDITCKPKEYVFNNEIYDSGNYIKGSYGYYQCKKEKNSIFEECIQTYSILSIPLLKV